MQGAVAKTRELSDDLGDVFTPSQFKNPANPGAHFDTSGPEIWRDTEGSVDILVAGIGTGGTITGTSRYLKTQNPDILTVGVEPAESPLLSSGRAAGHRIEGIGANFVPEVLDRRWSIQSCRFPRPTRSRPRELWHYSSGNALSLPQSGQTRARMHPIRRAEATLPGRFFCRHPLARAPANCAVLSLRTASLRPAMRAQTTS